MSDGENTPLKRPWLAPPWKPGQSGNPAGKPKGSRNKFGEDFIAALHDDFTKHGVDVIEKVRIDRPDQYLRVIAAVIPKEIQATDAASLTDMSDDELMEFVALLREATDSSRAGTGKSRVGAKARDQKPRSKPH